MNHIKFVFVAIVFVVITLTSFDNTIKTRPAGARHTVREDH